VPRDPAQGHPEIDPSGTALPAPRAPAAKPMSLVSSSAQIVPPPSKAMLNFRGRPYISRWFRM
jgi:hypothetical protein